MARRSGAAPDVLAAHEAVAARGRQEIQTGRFHQLGASQPAADIAPPTASQLQQLEAHQQQLDGDAARWSAGHGANGVLSQVGDDSASYGDGDAASAPPPPQVKRKGILKGVLRKSHPA